MPVTITLPDDLEAQLQREARAQHRSIEEIALGILSDALERANTFPTLEDVVARIKATAPNLHGIRPARGSLPTALRAVPEDPSFDLAQWNREWAVIALRYGLTLLTADGDFHAVPGLQHENWL